MLRTFLLFTHVVGVLMLFVALGLEVTSLMRLRRSGTAAEATTWLDFSSSLARLYPTAGAVILLTGGYLASNVGVWQFGWVRISLAALFVIGMLGGVSGGRMRAIRRATANRADASETLLQGLHDPRLPASLGVRSAAALAIVYLMIGKPDLVVSLIIIVASGMAGVIATLPAWHATPAARLS